MSNNDHNALDDLFSKQFENFAPPPPSGLWDNINSELNETEFDNVFRKKMMNASVQPSDEVWRKIAVALPLNLLLNRVLNYTSIIAGVLVLGMATQYGIMLFNSNLASPSTDYTENLPSYTSNYTPNQRTDVNISSLQADWQNERETNNTNYNRTVTATQREVEKQLSAIQERYRRETINNLATAIINNLSAYNDKQQFIQYDYTNLLSRFGSPELINSISPQLAIQEAMPNYMWFISELQERGSKDVVPNTTYNETRHKISRWSLYGGVQGGSTLITGNKVKENFAQGLEDVSARASFGGQLELGLNYAINKTLSLRSGINFDYFNQVFGENATNACSTLNANYLSVPLNVVYTPLGSHWSYSAGLSYGQLVNSNANNNTKNELAKQSFGINAGIDYTQAISPTTGLQIGARANLNKDFARLGTTNLLFGLRLGLIYSLGNAIP